MQERRVRVAVDAMGGDHAPRELVAGAVQAAREASALQVILVGRAAEVEPLVAAAGPRPANVAVVHAEEVIDMGDRPVATVRTRPDASIVRALKLVRERAADAVVAAGSTGAVVAACRMVLAPLPGVHRPGIAVPLPSRNAPGVCLLLDAGANVDSRPRNLLEYGWMGANYFRTVYRVESPRVGLVSVGEEEGKGNHVTREAARLLHESPLHFVGNVEGRDLFGGACDVAVADGFVGNIVLKSTEGCAEMLFGLVQEALGPTHPEAARAVARRMDYAEMGAAPLLGVDGVVMVSHGRSSARAIANAVRAAARVVEEGGNASIAAGLPGIGAARPAPAAAPPGARAAGEVKA